MPSEICHLRSAIAWDARKMTIDAELVRQLEIKATRLRRHIGRMVGVGKTGHIGGSCSAADIVAAARGVWEGGRDEGI